jgi:hypothetical protein
MKQSIISKKIFFKKSSNLKKDRQVFQYSLNNELLSLHMSIENATKSTCINSSSILNCCKKRNKTAGGYKWKFIPKEKRFFDKSNFVKMKGYDNYYINPNGDIFNYSNKKFISKIKNSIGFDTVNLYYDKEPNKHLVNYLVAQHYLPRNYESYNIYINHIDGDISNNHVNNLEWIN